MTVLIVSGKATPRVPAGISFHREHPNAPLTISNIDSSGVFSQSALIPGLNVLKLNDKDATRMSPEEANTMVQEAAAAASNSSSGFFQWTTSSQAEEATSISISAEGFIGRIDRQSKADALGIILKQSQREQGLILATIKEDSKFQGTELEEGMKIVSINGFPCPEKAKDAIRMMQNSLGKLKVVAVHSHQRQLNAVPMMESDTTFSEPTTVDATSTEALEAQAKKNETATSVSSRGSYDTKATKRAVKLAEGRRLMEAKKKHQKQEKSKQSNASTNQNAQIAKENARKAAIEKVVTNEASLAHSNSKKDEVVTSLHKIESKLKVSSNKAQQADKGTEMMKRLDRLEFSLNALAETTAKESSMGIKSKDAAYSEIFNVDERVEEMAANGRSQRSKKTIKKEQKASLNTRTSIPSQSDQELRPSKSTVIEVDEEPQEEKVARTPFRLFKLPRAPIKSEPKKLSRHSSEIIDLDRCQQEASLLPSKTKEMDVDEDDVSPGAKKVDFTGQVRRVAMVPSRPLENASSKQEEAKVEKESSRAVTFTGLNLLKKKEHSATITAQKSSLEQIVGIGFTHSTEHSPLKVAVVNDDGIFGETILTKGLVVKEINGKDMTWAYPIVAANEIKQATGEISITIQGVMPNASMVEVERQKRSLFAGAKYKKTDFGDYLQLELPKEVEESQEKTEQEAVEVAEVVKKATGDANLIVLTTTDDHCPAEVGDKKPVQEPVDLLKKPIQKEEITKEEVPRSTNQNSMKRGVLSELKLFSLKGRTKKKTVAKRQPVDPEPQITLPVRLEIDPLGAKERDVEIDPQGAKRRDVGIDSNVDQEQVEPEWHGVKAQITKTSKDDVLGFKVVKYKNRDGIFLSQIDEGSELQNSEIMPGMRIAKINGTRCPDNIPDTVQMVKSITGILEIEAFDMDPVEEAPDVQSVFSILEGTVSSIFDSVFESS